MRQLAGVEIRNTRATPGPESRLSGRRFALSLLAGAAAAAGTGIVLYYGLLSIAANALGSVLSQVVTFAVYATFLAVICYSFRPSDRPPIALRFTGIRNLLIAIGATILLIAVCALVYSLLGLFLGGFTHLAEQLTAVATDARRLQGQSSLVWIVAILRGCLLVPVFEEVVFRGLLLGWLNLHMRFAYALLVMSVLFAAMHLYPSAMPYAFLFGIASGYVRQATGSTLNAVVMHVINNIVLLAVGLHFFGR